jgi:glutamyl-Q tRNA(Asp) synthetase
LPLATDEHGRKLSKSTAAIGVDIDKPASILCAVLAFLNQSPPAELRTVTVAEAWNWAKSHWNVDATSAIAAKNAQG